MMICQGCNSRAETLYTRPGELDVCRRCVIATGDRTGWTVVRFEPQQDPPQRGRPRKDEAQTPRGRRRERITRAEQRRLRAERLREMRVAARDGEQIKVAGARYLHERKAPIAPYSTKRASRARRGEG